MSKKEEEEKLKDIYYYADNFDWNLPNEAMTDRKQYNLECLKGTVVYVLCQAVLLYFCIQIDKVAVIDFRDWDKKMSEDLLLKNFSFSKTYQKMFFRRDKSDSWFASDRVYETTYFSLGMFSYFIFSQVIGFTFVNTVNLQNIRKNPFYTKNDQYTKWNPYIGQKYYSDINIPRYQDIQSTVLFSVFLYFASG